MLPNIVVDASIEVSSRVQDGPVFGRAASGIISLTPTSLVLHATGG